MHIHIHSFISTTESIRQSIDNNEFGCGIFIDLKKAFDTINHTILLTKLNHYGIRCCLVFHPHYAEGI